MPALRSNTSGITWGGGQTPGTSIPIDQFYIARSGVDTAATINAALGQGKHLQVGPPGSTASHAGNPTSLHDVFAKIGSQGTAKAVVSLQINSSNVIVDHTWLWRADHGDGLTGWNVNTAQNGLVVNGANVTIYGLFVEHFQQYQVIWNGNGGRVYFYQSEIPYDPPDQVSWRSAGNVNGWASYKVADAVTSHEAFGMGTYAVFTNANVFLTRAIEVPNKANVKFHHMMTVNLTNNGGISNVINDRGGATRPGLCRTRRTSPSIREQAAGGAFSIGRTRRHRPSASASAIRHQQRRSVVGGRSAVSGRRWAVVGGRSSVGGRRWAVVSCRSWQPLRSSSVLLSGVAPRVAAATD